MPRQPTINAPALKTSSSGFPKIPYFQYLPSILIKVANALLLLATSIFLARTLPLPAFGTYAFYLAWVVALGVPVHIGLPNLVVREASTLIAHGDRDGLGAFMRYATQLSVSVSVLIFLGALVVVLLGSGAHLDANNYALLIAFAALPFSGLSRLLECYLQANKMFTRGQITEKVLFPSLYLLLLLLAFAVAQKTALAALSAYFAATVLGLGVILALSKGLLWQPTSGPTDKRTKRHWAAQTAPLTALAAMSLLMSQTDLLMMGFLLPAESVGLYRVALTVSALSVFFISPLSVILAPQLVREWSAANKANVQTLVTETARLSFLLSLPLFAVVFVFSSQIVGILYGEAFADSSVPLVILCAGQLVNVSTGFVHVVLNMTKHHNITLRGVGFAVAANVILNALLIPQFGIIGGAIATSAAVVLANVYLLIKLRSATGIDSSVLGLGKQYA